MILNFALEELVRDPGNSNNNNTRTSLEKVTAKKSELPLFYRTVYHKVASIRSVYYSILDLLGQRSQYIRVKFPFNKLSENLKMCH